MSKRGRKPTPTKIKELRGTDRADRQLENEIEFDQIKTIPSPPNKLTDEAKELWYAVFQQLAKIGLLSKIGAFQLERYCEYYDVFVTASENIRTKSGKLQLLTRKKLSTGQMQVSKNPYWQIMREATEEMRKIETEWGFTPSSATRIPAPDSDGKKDDFDSKFEI